MLTRLCLCLASVRAQLGFVQSDEALYLGAWDTLVADSHSAVASAPAALTAQCASKGTAFGGQPIDFPTYTLSSGEYTAAQAQAACGTATVCIVAEEATLRLESSLDVAALVIRGAAIWDDASQTADDQWLCAGYVATEPGGMLNVTVHNRRAWIYIKDNSAHHANLTVRAFGGVQSTVELSGRPLRRTWSLLATPVAAGAESISLLHDPVEMGWQVGDRIMIAPTAVRSSGEAEAFSITGFGSRNTVLLSGATAQAFSADFARAGAAGPALLSAEVVHLSRSLVVTGDPFAHVPCAAFSTTAATCTMGLHTIMMGGGGSMRVRHARVERCGQRGVLGKYCLHMHLISACPSCRFEGNAVEFGQQRGLVVHGTHQATVAENVFADVRGAGLYVEDGNELLNVIRHNVVICPWAREGPKYGCTVPGTDNTEADTSNNQAGMWSLPTLNHVVGNRFSNSFNGMFFQANFAGGRGRGEASGLLCTESQQLGRIQGNTCHGNGRFGTYLLGPNFPRPTDQSVASDGAIGDFSLCDGFTAAGGDNGVSTLLSDNVDYDNTFVGQYDLGDIQYARHTSLNNLNLIYWKTTKNMADGCSAHLHGGVFSGGNMGLPDQAAFLIEQVTFEGAVTLEADHHCDEGVTGVLCSPTYVFVDVTWRVTSAVWMYWFQPGGYAGASYNTRGGVFALAPPEEANPDGHIFPAGYCALASATFAYLTALDGGAACATAESLGLAQRYSDGVLCRRPLRALRVYTRGLTEATAQQLRVELWQGGALTSTLLLPYHQIGADGSTRKQGYALPVATDKEGHVAHSYRISLEDGSGLDPDWVIEFSDPIFGNRWEADTVTLEVAGRDCGASVSSQHDRAFLWAGVANADHLADGAWGRGACTAHADLPVVDCSAQAPLALPECDGCGEAEAANMCEAARCGEHGACTATFLGGDLPVSRVACVCEPPWTGDLCDQNPCAAVTDPCGGHGECAGVGDSDFACTCDAGYSGRRCEHNCNALCAGSFPFNCNPSGGPIVLCNGGGGCSYPASLDGVEGLGIDWCPMVFTDACDAVVCDKPSDCWLSGACADGACASATVRPNGTACNSAELGACGSGVCVRGVGGPSGGGGSGGGGGDAAGVAAGVLSALAVLFVGGLVAWRCRVHRGRSGRPMHAKSCAQLQAAEQANPRLSQSDASAIRNSRASKGGSMAAGTASVRMAATAPVAPPSMPSLPAGWEEHVCDDGTPYYYNAASGVTQWERPSPPPKPPGPKPPLRVGAGASGPRAVGELQTARM